MNSDSFNEKFLDILVCPQTRKSLYYDKKNNCLSTRDGKLSYKIKNGIPKLIAEK